MIIPKKFNFVTTSTYFVSEDVNSLNVEWFKYGMN